MPSKGQVDRAGALLRAWWASEGGNVGDPEIDAFNVLWDYRATFQYPLTKVNANLRYYVKKAGCQVFIAQRLKRLPRILDKMQRHPRMRLTQMQDVGGCRALLPDQADVQRVLNGIQQRWDIITVDNYVSQPKVDGYRAVHVIVRKEAVPIEVQLRTFGQQDWADEVERLDGRAPYALKDGEGPPEVLRYLWLLAEVIAAQETGQTADNAQTQELRSLRPFLP